MSKFLNLYKQEMVQIASRQYPTLSPEKIEEVVEKMIEKRLKDREVVFHNDYDQSEATLGLLKFTDWTLGKKRPILAGNGSTFKQHSDPTSVNLPAMMLQYLLGSRKRVKKEMFNAMQNAKKFREEGDEEQAKHWDEIVKAKDREQKVIKLLANSYYGASGEKNSIFYNMNMGAAVTYTGVEIITTAVMAFEAFLANNILFNDADDVLAFIDRVLGEEHQYYVREVIDGEFLKDNEVVTKYLLSLIKPEGRRESDGKVISRALENVDVDQCTRIYYKRNLYEFLSHSSAAEVLKRVVGTEFMNVEHPPEEIHEDMKFFWSLLKEYVVYDRAYEDRYERAVNDRRKAVIVVDTDSNFINLGPFYDYITELYPVEQNETMRVSIINIAIYILGFFVQMALDRLTSNINVPEDKQPIINMKNEFLYSRLMLTSNKKQYAGRLVAQEGNLLLPPKLDMKGMSIKKVTVNSQTRGFFKKLLEKDVLESETIDLSEILGKFSEFEGKIRESLLSGKLEFAVPANLNEYSSYKFPYRMQQVRGAMIWNELFPDETIQPPEKVNTLKLKVGKIEDLKPIFDTDEFEIIQEKVFANAEMKNYGFTIISVPKGRDTLPEWLVQFVDVENIVADNIRNGIIILESLGIKTMEISQSSYYSNIIEF